MKRSTSALDRIVAALLGLVLVAAGALGIAAAYDIAPADAWTSGLRPSRLPEHIGADWFTWALAATAVVAVVLSLALIAANLDRRLTPTKFDDGDSPAAPGEIRFHLDDIADAVAERLHCAPGVRRARGRAEVDRGDETITITLHLDHDADLGHIRGLCADAAEDVADAIGDVRAGTRFLINLDREPRH